MVDYVTIFLIMTRKKKIRNAQTAKPPIRSPPNNSTADRNSQYTRIDFSKFALYVLSDSSGFTVGSPTAILPESPGKDTTTGGIMSDFEATSLAITKLKEYMSQNSIDSALRVALMQGG